MTHLAAALVGCLAWKLTAGGNFPAEARDTPVPKLMKSARDRSETTGRDAHGKRDKAERLRHGETVLAKIAGTDAAMPGSAADGDPGMEPTELIRLADSLKPDGDPEAAVRRARERYQDGQRKEDCRELEARHLLWLRADAKAALDAKLPPGLTAIRALALERGWREMLQYRHNGPLSLVWVGICEDFSRNGNPSDYDGIRAVMEDYEKPRILDNLAIYWPMEKADRLLELLAENTVEESDLIEAAGALLKFAKKSRPTGPRWLFGKMASPSMDQGLKDAVDGPLYRNLIATTPNAKAGTPEVGKSTDEAGAEGHFSNVMEQVLMAERDWKYAFRHGAVTAEEMLDAMRKADPGQAAEHPEALRRALYLQLLEENPTAAMMLLDHLPEAERWQVALDTDHKRPGGEDPRAMLAFLQQIPAGLADNLWEARFSLWRHTSYDMSTFEDSYLRWVETLPPGTDRDMAVHRAVETIRERGEESFSPPLDPARVQRLADTIRDPRLLQKLKEEEQ